MKHILCAIMILLSLTSHAQKGKTFDYPLKDGKITLEKTEAIKGTKKQLYQRVLQWIASQKFDRAERVPLFDKVITYENEEEGKIFGYGKFVFDTKYPDIPEYDRMVMIFTYKFNVKDNEVSYKITDFEVKQLTWHKKPWANTTTPFEDFKTTGYYRKFSDQSIDDNMKQLEKSIKAVLAGKW